jgi:hypothetical protein
MEHCRLQSSMMKGARFIPWGEGGSGQKVRGRSLAEMVKESKKPSAAPSEEFAKSPIEPVQDIPPRCAAEAAAGLAVDELHQAVGADSPGDGFHQVAGQG